MKTTLCMMCAVLALTACAPRAAFVRTGEGARPARAVDQVAVYFDAAAVPFQFVEVGRVFMDIKPGEWVPADTQIKAIRERAAQMGAEAVVLQSQTMPYAKSRQDGLMLSKSVQGTMPVFSGLAIAKK